MEKPKTFQLIEKHTTEGYIHTIDEQSILELRDILNHCQAMDPQTDLQLEFIKRHLDNALQEINNGY